MKTSTVIHTLSTLALLIISASQSLFATEQPQQGGDLTWAVETEPNTLNPQLNGQDKTELLLRAELSSLRAEMLRREQHARDELGPLVKQMEAALLTIAMAGK